MTHHIDLDTITLASGGHATRELFAPGCLQVLPRSRAGPHQLQHVDVRRSGQLLGLPQRPLGRRHLRRWVSRRHGCKLHPVQFGPCRGQRRRCRYRFILQGFELSVQPLKRTVQRAHGSYLRRQSQLQFLRG